MMRTFDFAKVPIADIINDILVDSSKKVLVIFTLILMRTIY